MTTNKINFRSTLAALALGALVTAIPAVADTVSFTTSSSPTALGVAGQYFSFSGATVTDLSIGTPPTTLASNPYASTNSTANSFGGFSITPLANCSVVACAAGSSAVQIDLTPTNINGTSVNEAPLIFDGSIAYTGGANGTYSLNFAAGDGGVAGTGAYVGDIVHTVGNITYAVPDSIALSNKTSSFFVTGIVGSSAPEPATLATTGLAVAFLGMFLRRKAKQIS